MEDVYRTLVENSPDVSMLTDAGVVQWISGQVLDLIGWRPEELVGRSTSHLWHPDDRAAAVALYDGVHHGRTGRGVFRLMTRDRRYVWVETTLKPYHGRRGGRAGAIGIMRDVGARIAAEQARASAEEQYRLIAENASDVVIRTSPTGFFEWLSPSVGAHLGWRPEQLVGRYSLDLVHPEDAARVQSVRESVNPEDPYVVELRLRTADGTYRWVSAAVRPLLDDAGALVARVGGWRDIQAEVEARRVLADREVRYRLLADNATDVVLLLDAEGEVAWVARTITRTLGWEPGALVGASLTELVHPEDREQAGAALARMMPGGEGPDAEPIEFLVRVRTRTGTFRWMSGTGAQAVRDGVWMGVVCGLRDVDELVGARTSAQADRARLRATLDSLVDPHAVLEAVRDATGRITDFLVVEANAAACEFNGRTHDELVGASLLGFGSPASRLLSAYRHVVDTGESLILDDSSHLDEQTGEERWFDIRGVRVDDWLSLTWRDVTDRHLAAAALAESERQYRLLAENASDIVLRLRAGVVVWASPSLRHALGWHRADWEGRHLEEFVDAADLPVDLEAEPPAGGGSAGVCRFRVRDSSGGLHWVDSHAAPHVDDHGRRDGSTAALRLVDEQVAAEEELVRRARFDSLTGLPNRGEVLDRLVAIADRARVAGRGCAVLFCDLDQFKDVNDTYGHAAGDEVLRIVAARVRASVRPGDVAGRLGGDELLIVLDGVVDLDDAVALGTRILTAVGSAPITVGAAEIATTLSIGATLVVPGEGAGALIARADRAMLTAKRVGRNQVIPIAAPRRRTGG